MLTYIHSYTKVIAIKGELNIIWHNQATKNSNSETIVMCAHLPLQGNIQVYFLEMSNALIPLPHNSYVAVGRVVKEYATSNLMMI